MRSAIYILFIFFLSDAAGQALNDCSVEESNAAMLKSNMLIQDLIGIENDTYFYSLTDKSGQIRGLGKISSAGNNVSTLEIPECYSNNVLTYTFKGEVYLYYVLETEDSLLLLQTKYDSGLKPISSKTLDGHEKLSTRQKGSFVFRTDQKNKQFGVIQYIPQESHKTEFMKVSAYGFSGKKLWTNPYDTKFKQTISPITHFEISPAGNIHVIRRIRKGMSFQFYLISFTERGQKTKIQELEVRGNRITEMTLAIGKNEKLIIAGLSSDTEENSSNHYFYKIYTKDGHSQIEMNQSIPREMFINYLGEKKADKKDAALENVFVELILPVGDKFYLFFEEIIDKEEFNKKNTVDRERYMAFGNLSVITLSKGGDLEAVYTFHKDQKSWNDDGYFSSFIPAYTDSTLLLIYNTITTDGKSKTNTYNTSTKYITIHVQDLKYSEKTMPSTNLLSSELSLYKNGEWYYILTDKNRQSLVPARLKCESPD